MWTTVLKFITPILSFIKNNPKFFLGVIFALVIAMLFKQCGDIRDLKHEIEVKETEIKNEQNRFENNIESLTDSVEYHKEQSLYSRTLLRVKEGELEMLDGKLANYKAEIQRLANIIQEGSKVKNVYITDISSEIDKHDVMTIVQTDSSGNFSVGISDTNQIISINTESWFRLEPYENKLKLILVDKFGQDSVSRLNYNLNFSLGLSQIELPNGRTRVIVQPRDVYGNPIPQNILNIPFVNGADFMDVEPSVLPTPDASKNKRGFGIMVGPSYGIYYQNSSFIPTWGMGIVVGYKLF